METTCLEQLTIKILQNSFRQNRGFMKISEIRSQIQLYSNKINCREELLELHFKGKWQNTVDFQMLESDDAYFVFSTCCIIKYQLKYSTLLWRGTSSGSWDLAELDP